MGGSAIAGVSFAVLLLQRATKGYIRMSNKPSKPWQGVTNLIGAPFFF